MAPSPRHPKSNPADRATAELRALFLALWGREVERVPAGFFRRLRLIPQSAIERAITTGRIKHVTRHPEYRRALDRLTEDVRRVERKTIERGIRSGLREVPSSSLHRRAADFAEELFSPRAIALVQNVDLVTREALSAMVRSAAGRYARRPDLDLLRDLAKEVQGNIGLTVKQLRQLRQQGRNLRSRGIPLDQARPILRARAARMVELRSKMIADRAVTESISVGRLESWRRSRDEGELPQNARKRAMDQGDDRVRRRHREMTLIGPLPLEEPFPVFGVLTPPWPEHGCRCWLVLDF